MQWCPKALPSPLQWHMWMHTSFVASRALRNYSPGFETDNPRSLQRKPAEDIGHQIPPPLLAVSRQLWYIGYLKPPDLWTRARQKSKPHRIQHVFVHVLVMKLHFSKWNYTQFWSASILLEPNAKHVITKMLDAAPSKVFGPARDCKIVIPTIGRILAAEHHQRQNFGCRTPMGKSLKGPHLRGR